jgi:hypothetical protein
MILQHNVDLAQRPPVSRPGRGEHVVCGFVV